MRFSLASALVVTLAAQATANSWFGNAGAYSGNPLLLLHFLVDFSSTRSLCLC